MRPKVRGERAGGARRARGVLLQRDHARALPLAQRHRARRTAAVRDARRAEADDLDVSNPQLERNFFQLLTFLTSSNFFLTFR